MSSFSRRGPAITTDNKTVGRYALGSSGHLHRSYVAISSFKSPNVFAGGNEGWSIKSFLQSIVATTVLISLLSLCLCTIGDVVECSYNATGTSGKLLHPDRLRRSLDLGSIFSEHKKNEYKQTTEGGINVNSSREAIEPDIGSYKGPTTISPSSSNSDKDATSTSNITGNATNINLQNPFINAQAIHNLTSVSSTSMPGNSQSSDNNSSESNQDQSRSNNRDNQLKATGSGDNNNYTPPQTKVKITEDQLKRDIGQANVQVFVTVADPKRKISQTQQLLGEGQKLDLPVSEPNVINSKQQRRHADNIAELLKSRLGLDLIIRSDNGRNDDDTDSKNVIDVIDHTVQHSDGNIRNKLSSSSSLSLARAALRRKKIGHITKKQSQIKSERALKLTKILCRKLIKLNGNQSRNKKMFKLSLFNAHNMSDAHWLEYHLDLIARGQYPEITTSKRSLASRCLIDLHSRYNREHQVSEGFIKSLYELIGNEGRHDGNNDISNDISLNIYRENRQKFPLQSKSMAFKDAINNVDARRLYETDYVRGSKIVMLPETDQELFMDNQTYQQHRYKYDKSNDGGNKSYHSLSLTSKASQSHPKPLIALVEKGLKRTSPAQVTLTTSISATSPLPSLPSLPSLSPLSSSSSVDDSKMNLTNSKSGCCHHDRFKRDSIDTISNIVRDPLQAISTIMGGMTGMLGAGAKTLDSLGGVAGAARETVESLGKKSKSDKSDDSDGNNRSGVKQQQHQSNSGSDSQSRNDATNRPLLEQLSSLFERDKSSGSTSRRPRKQGSRSDISYSKKDSDSDESNSDDDDDGSLRDRRHGKKHQEDGVSISTDGDIGITKKRVKAKSQKPERDGDDNEESNLDSLLSRIASKSSLKNINGLQQQLSGGSTQNSQVDKHSRTSISGSDSNLASMGSMEPALDQIKRKLDVISDKLLENNSNQPLKSVSFSSDDAEQSIVDSKSSRSSLIPTVSQATSQPSSSRSGPVPSSSNQSTDIASRVDQIINQLHDETNHQPKSFTDPVKQPGQQQPQSGGEPSVNSRSSFPVAPPLETSTTPANNPLNQNQSSPHTTNTDAGLTLSHNAPSQAQQQQQTNYGPQVDQQRNNVIPPTAPEISARSSIQVSPSLPHPSQQEQLTPLNQQQSQQAQLQQMQLSQQMGSSKSSASASATAGSAPSFNIALPSSAGPQQSPNLLSNLQQFQQPKLMSDDITTKKLQAQLEQIKLQQQVLQQKIQLQQMQPNVDNQLMPMIENQLGSYALSEQLEKLHSNKLSSGPLIVTNNDGPLGMSSINNHQKILNSEHHSDQINSSDREKEEKRTKQKKELVITIEKISKNRNKRQAKSKIDVEDPTRFAKYRSKRYANHEEGRNPGLSIESAVDKMTRPIIGEVIGSLLSRSLDLSSTTSTTARPLSTSASLSTSEPSTTTTQPHSTSTTLKPTTTGTATTSVPQTTITSTTTTPLSTTSSPSEPRVRNISGFEPDISLKHPQSSTKDVDEGSHPTLAEREMSDPRATTTRLPKKETTEAASSKEESMSTLHQNHHDNRSGKKRSKIENLLGMAKVEDESGESEKENRKLIPIVGSRELKEAGSSEVVDRRQRMLMTTLKPMDKLVGLAKNAGISVIDTAKKIHDAAMKPINAAAKQTERPFGSDPVDKNKLIGTGKLRESGDDDDDQELSKVQIDDKLGEIIDLITILRTKLASPHNDRNRSRERTNRAHSRAESPSLLGEFGQTLKQEHRKDKILSEGSIPIVGRDPSKDVIEHRIYQEETEKALRGNEQESLINTDISAKIVEDTKYDGNAEHKGKKADHDLDITSSRSSHLVTQPNLSPRPAVKEILKGKGYVPPNVSKLIPKQDDEAGGKLGSLEEARQLAAKAASVAP